VTAWIAVVCVYVCVVGVTLSVWAAELAFRLLDVSPYVNIHCLLDVSPIVKGIRGPLLNAARSNECLYPRTLACIHGHWLHRASQCNPWGGRARLGSGRTVACDAACGCVLVALCTLKVVTDDRGGVEALADAFTMVTPLGAFRFRVRFPVSASSCGFGERGAELFLRGILGSAGATFFCFSSFERDKGFRTRVFLAISGVSSTSLSLPLSSLPNTSPGSGLPRGAGTEARCELESLGTTLASAPFLWLGAVSRQAGPDLLRGCKGVDAELLCCCFGPAAAWAGARAGWKVGAVEMAGPELAALDATGSHGDWLARGNRCSVSAGPGDALSEAGIDRDPDTGRRSCAALAATGLDSAAVADADGRAVLETLGGGVLLRTAAGG
jgi:hypothetical protein